MKFRIFITTVAVASASRMTTQAPRVEPTDSALPPSTTAKLDARADGMAAGQDRWECATENITQYFDVPMPTGSLLDALVSHGLALTAKECTSTGPQRLNCPPITNTAGWCDFTAYAPSTLLADYSSHISKASSWSSAHSSGLAALPTDCPETWNTVKTRVFAGELGLNNTLAWAKCYAQRDAKGPNNSAPASTAATPAQPAQTTVQPESTGASFLSTARIGRVGFLIVAAMVVFAVA